MAGGLDTYFLYVEDDPMSREVMKILLVYGLGYSNLTMFENSANFMEKVQTLPKVPDMFILDIQVRPLDGFEMLKLLRAHETYRESLIIALTASVLSEQISQLKVAGFDGCIGKPIDQNTFPQNLKRILSGQKVWSIS